MGSRRGRYAALVIAALGSTSASCTRGAPPGFSEGTSWTVPLVGPLEEGQLLVPALVNGHGPFVFAIDTDAHVSSVDTDVVQIASPRTGEGPDLLDESDTERDRFYAEILEWNLGSLTVKNKPAQIVPARAFDIEGRRIHGVIGRDILADSLVFAFDRDRGEVLLTTKSSFKPEPTWRRIDYARLSSQVQNAQVVPQARKLVDAFINDVPFKLHLDFGATASQLRMRSWTKAKLTESPLTGAVVDEVATPRKVTKQGVAASVSLGVDATTPDVAFIPYADKRWPEQDLEGSLGLDFFKPFVVHVDWDTRAIYLRPRPALTADTTLARIGRWHSKTLSGCANPGCVKITLIDPLANTPPEQRPATHPGVVASITRDPAAKQLDLEVLVAVTAADGTTPLKWLIVNMPYGVERTLTHLSADYVGAFTTVLDASPFPRECPKVASAGDESQADAEPSPQGGCVDLLTPPQPFTSPRGAPSGGAQLRELGAVDYADRW